MEVASSFKTADAQAKKLSPEFEVDSSERALKYAKVSGFAKTHGQDLEVTLAALLFLRGLNSGLDFQHGTNVQGAGSLDDAVFRFKENEVWTTMFVQLKHKDNSWVNKMMLTNPKGDFSLAKYFKSYNEIKQAMSAEAREVLFDGSFEDCQFAIFTNAKADANLVGARSGNSSQAEKFLWTGSGSLLNLEEDQDILDCLGDKGGEFLSRLRLFCGQPSAKKLKAAIKKELQMKLDKGKIQDTNIERLCDCYFGNVKVWWESRNEILHKDHDILQQALNKVRLESCSEQTLKEYKLELDFEDFALLDLKMQLVQVNSRLVHVVSSETSCRLTLTKIVQATEGQSLVLSCDHLAANRPALLAECQNVDLKRLVVIINKGWRSVQHDVINEMLESLRDTFSIVLLSDGNNSIDSELSERLQNNVKSYAYQDNFKVPQLKPGSKDAMLNKIVNFQSHEITLGTLLNNDYERLDQVLNASLAVDILESVGPLTIGSALPEVIGHYIKRALEQALCLKASVFQSLQGTVTVRITQSEALGRGLFGKALDFVNLINDLPSFSHGDKEDIVNKLVQSPLVYDKKDCEVFIGPKFPLGFYEFNFVGLRFGQEHAVTALHVCPSKEGSLQVGFLFVSNETTKDDVTKLSEFHQSKHLLSLKDSQVRWIQSLEDIESIRKHIDEDQVLRFAPETAMDVEDRLVLVCAEPGMGKSTLMAWLAKKTKAAFPHYFVILIALNDNSKLFSEGKHPDVLDFLSIAAKMESPLQRSLLKFALEVSGNVVVLADGFDEITPKFVAQSCDFLSSLLNKTKASKIWMTSRNSVKQILETHFSKFSAKICEFDKGEQKNFLQKFWAGKSIEEKLNEFIDRLLEKSAQAIGEKERNFLGIPLQTRMLAEVYEDHVTGSNKEMQLPQKLDLLSLVEKFVELKYEIYFRDKALTANFNLHKEMFLPMSRNDFLASHTNAALILILGDDYIKSLGFGRILTESSTFFKTIKRGAYKTGFIDEIVNDKPRFIHRVFAEYLVANWISQHFESKLKLVKSKMFTPEFTVIRYFFNGILCKDCVLHTAVLQENVEQVKTLLESEDVAAQDVGGRTALHLAASLGASEDQEENKRRCKILDLIIGKTSDFRVVDKVLCGSPLRYADITRWWTAIDKLLCKTDDNGELGLTFGNVRDANMLDTIFDQDLDKLLGFCLDNGLAVEHRSENRFHLTYRLLAHACQEGCVNVASLLIERNANTGRTIYENQGPLIAASCNGHLEIVKPLVEKYLSTLASPLGCKAPGGETYHSDAFKYIIEEDRHGETALHWAARHGHTDVVTYLLSQGGDPRNLNGFDETPLHLAARSNKPDTLKVLLEALSEADRAAAIHTQDIDGGHVMHHAAQGGSVKCVEHVVEAGGKLFQLGWNGKTPLMTAARYGKREVVKWLLENFNAEREGITLVEFINMKDKDGKTAWDWALTECCEVIAKFIK